MPISLTDFPARALSLVPELTDELAEGDGLPYVQMGAFARLIQRAKGRADCETYARAARFADELWSAAADGLRTR
jgi:hypothetical protein